MMQPHAFRFENQKIANLYKAVPVEQVEKLYRFRAAYPHRRTTINSVEWHYIVAGEDKPAILVLPGVLSTAESTWQTIIYFTDNYRMISPSYPPVSTMTELVDGIAEIMDRVGIGKAHVIGGSYGGFVAQVFVRLHSDKTEKLVISHAGIPDVRRGRKLHGMLRWLSLLPVGVLRAMFKKRISGMLPVRHVMSALLEAYIKEIVYYHWTKENIIEVYRRMVDFDTSHIFSPHDLADWSGEVLLIMADNDPATPESVRKAMKALYPQAEVYLFSDTGHAGPILKRDEYFSVIDTFIG